MNSSKDYYNILEVDKYATIDTIKSSYRSLAKKYHPDKNQGNKEAEDKFKEVSEAYEILGNVESRSKYDATKFRTNSSNGRSTFTGYEPFGFKFDNEFWDAQDFGDLWTRAKKGKDVTSVVTLTLEEVATGCDKIINLYSENLKVNIPKGVKAGDRMTIPGKGELPESGSGEKGDLIIMIRVSKHPDFERLGNNLLHRAKVGIPEILLGCSLVVPVLGGKVKITVPPRLEIGSRLKLKGKGILGGDLEVEIHPYMPKLLSKRELELIEELRKYPNMAPLKL